MILIRQIKWLLPSLAFSILLLGVRMAHTQTIDFSFLTWNLFLAFVPVWFSRLALSNGNTWKGWAYAALWLLFFPNAMYIITDLFHLWKHPGVPLWYDLLLIFSFAMNGIAMGFYSLYRIEKWLGRHITAVWIRPIRMAIMIASGFGVYLGRFQRWNSWDIVTQPLSLLKDITGHLIHPFRHADSWEISLLFGIWMYLVYQYLVRLLQYGRAQRSNE